jgi:hypothetical protein
MMTPAQAIERVADYIEANAHRLPDWVPEDRNILRAALGFHALNGTLRVEWSHVLPSVPVADSKQMVSAGETRGSTVAGLAIVWPDIRSEVERLAQAKQSIFRWRAGHHHATRRHAEAGRVVCRAVWQFRTRNAERGTRNLAAPARASAGQAR